MSEATGLLAVARHLLEHPLDQRFGPRAVVILARQALEAGLDDFWRQREPSLNRCSTRAQLLCLRHYVPEAESVGQLWAELSGACHYHSYQLLPTVTELRRWVDGVDALLGALGKSHQEVKR